MEKESGSDILFYFRSAGIDKKRRRFKIPSAKASRNKKIKNNNTQPPDIKKSTPRRRVTKRSIGEK